MVRGAVRVPEACRGAMALPRSARSRLVPLGTVDFADLSVVLTASRPVRSPEAVRSVLVLSLRKSVARDRL